MLRLFSVPTHKDPKNLNLFTGIEVIVLTPLRASTRHWRHYFFACLVDKKKLIVEGEKEVLETSITLNNVRIIKPWP